MITREFVKENIGKKFLVKFKFPTVIENGKDKHNLMKEGVFSFIIDAKSDAIRYIPPRLNAMSYPMDIVFQKNVVSVEEVPLDRDELKKGINKILKKMDTNLNPSIRREMNEVYHSTDGDDVVIPDYLKYPKLKNISKLFGSKNGVEFYTGLISDAIKNRSLFSFTKGANDKREKDYTIVLKNSNVGLGFEGRVFILEQGSDIGDEYILLNPTTALFYKSNSKP